jgi:hypothetical protein
MTTRPHVHPSLVLLLPLPLLLCLFSFHPLPFPPHSVSLPLFSSGPHHCCCPHANPPLVSCLLSFPPICSVAVGQFTSRSRVHPFLSTLPLGSIYHFLLPSSRPQIHLIPANLFNMARGEHDRPDPTLIIEGSRRPQPSKRIQGHNYPITPLQELHTRDKGKLTLQYTYLSLNPVQ